MDHALEDFELLATRLLHDLGAAALVRIGQLSPFAGRRGDRDDESDGDRSVSLRRPNDTGRASVEATGTVRGRLGSCQACRNSCGL
jgi:hypothetical protein